MATSTPATSPGAQPGGLSTREAASTRSSGPFVGLAAVTGGFLLVTLYWAFFKAPFESVMGAAQKIFYFHVPAAYALYLSAAVCFAGSAAYLYRASDRADALARAGADVAVAFGAIVLTTGPIWARPIWGVYWTWEPRLLTSLLSVLIYVAYVVLRSFAGDGDAERRFAAALGVLGAANLPIIHYSVQKWGGNHPRVISSGGGGLGHPDMKTALGLGFLAFSLLAATLIWGRLRLHLSQARVARLEEEAAARGLLGDEALETLMQTQTTLPADTPTPAFSGAPSRDDPMRNFGYTVAAYAVLWCVLLAFVVRGWRRQVALDARLDDLERALARGESPGSGRG